MTSLSPTEKIQIVQQIYSMLKLLTEDDALAGIILKDTTYDQFKRYLGPACIPYSPAEITLDPNMEHSFVVDGMLVLRGTRLQ